MSSVLLDVTNRYMYHCNNLVRDSSETKFHQVFRNLADIQFLWLRSLENEAKLVHRTRSQQPTPSQRTPN